MKVKTLHELFRMRSDLRRRTPGLIANQLRRSSAIDSRRSGGAGSMRGKRLEDRF